MLITQGSITVKRMRRGYAITMHFENVTGVALYQGVDSAGNVSPHWNVKDANGAYSHSPQLKPVLDPVNGMTPKIVDGTAKWKYLSIELEFDKDGNCTTTANDCNKKFKLSTDGTYTLIICGDLANANNDSNDLLTFDCMASVSGAQEMQCTGTVDIVITPLGASSYQGIVGIVGSKNITKDHTSIKLTLSLLYGTVQQKAFKYAIVKAGTAPTASDMKYADVSNSNYVFTLADAIKADDVNGQTTFFIYFYTADETDPTKYVDVDGLSVLDLTDQYKILYLYKDPAKMQIDDDSSVVLQPYIVPTNSSDSLSAVKYTSATWKHLVYRGKINEDDDNPNLELKRTVTTETVELTTADSDEEEEVTTVSGKVTKVVQRDVSVVGEVQFTV